jgi:hypothetical protein
LEDELVGLKFEKTNNKELIMLGYASKKSSKVVLKSRNLKWNTNVLLSTLIIQKDRSLKSIHEMDRINKLRMKYEKHTKTIDNFLSL